MRRSDQPQPALGKAIRQLREERGMTQEALAQEADVTVGHMSMIERGHSNPTWATVKAIAEALDASLVELTKLAVKFESHTMSGADAPSD
jgi:transcriptional regulator with XRE-family HTH domain